MSVEICSEDACPTDATDPRHEHLPRGASVVSPFETQRHVSVIRSNSNAEIGGSAIVELRFQMADLVDLFHVERLCGRTTRRSGNDDKYQPGQVKHRDDRWPR